MFLVLSSISPEVAEDALDKTVSSAADVVEGSCMRGYVQRVCDFFCFDVFLQTLLAVVDIWFSVISMSTAFLSFLLPAEMLISCFVWCSFL